MLAKDVILWSVRLDKPEQPTSINRFAFNQHVME